MPKSGLKFVSTHTLLTLDQLKRLLKIFRGLGMAKLRLTGGEPLLRPDLEEILAEAQFLGIPDISLTTNGVLLSTRIKSLAAAGLKRINISLDTFQRERFYEITGMDAVDRVLQGIWDSVHEGLEPVKINVVVMREWNLDEIREFALFAKRAPIEVRFLELMPTANSFEGTAGVDEKSFVSMDEIKREVERAVELGTEEPSLGVARVFPLLDGIGKIGFVSPVSNHFCSTCNRVRLTAQGILKTCLHGPESVNLKEALERGASDGEISDMIRNDLLLKPEEHFIRPDHYISRTLQMSQVGG
jgi:cyclic pyranopterin phosphate synthase